MKQDPTMESVTPPAVGSDEPAFDFDMAPVPLWLEDWSGISAKFDMWRQAGVTDLAAFLAEDRGRVRECSALIRVLGVNKRTLALFEAADLPDLIANLHKVFSDEMLENHVDELVQLWSGASEFTSQAVNHTLSGRRLDIQLKAQMLPGHEQDWARILIATEDVTEREDARRRASLSESYARGLFEHSPVSLWVEDFSAVKNLIEGVRDRGVTDFRTFLDVHPEFVTRCMSEIRVIDVNQHTLDLFHAPDKATLLRRLGEVFRDGMELHFKEQLIDLWMGKLFQQREVVNYSLDGDSLHVHMQFSVLPGRERDWTLVQVALTDITARKKAEAYLEYLGKHEVLTRLYNRSFYVDELNRLERMGPYPVTVIIADLNGLKPINDELGHAAGDAMLRRAGEVLNGAVSKPHHAARIGGDEFCVLMPATAADEAQAMVDAIEKLTEINNQFYAGNRLSFSIGCATGVEGERLEEVVKRADAAMYERKREYYSVEAIDRRRRDAKTDAAHL
ncbi:diguanylate cyclase [Aureimonas sp. SA4125]|nr:diguanylate cyclase [Aureimonas sp. SA4125]